MRYIFMVFILIGLTSCGRCTPSKPAEGKPCKPDVLAQDGAAVSSECGPIGSGATCFVPRGASVGACRQYDLKTIERQTRGLEWKQAFSYCDSLAKDGFKWRLPTVQELESLCDGEVYNDPPKRQVSGKGGCIHSASILGTRFKELEMAWSGTCSSSAEPSFIRNFLSGWRIDNEDTDCTLPSSNAAILVGLGHDGYVNSADLNFGAHLMLCVRQP